MEVPSRFKIYQLHIAEGFYDDCDELIRKCVEGYQNVTYPVFVKVWKQMNMAGLYQGRITCAEIAELSEEVIQVAKEFLISDTTNCEELFAAVFLVYALVKLQPYSGFASLRICPDDIQSIQHIESEARKHKRLDVLYVLGTLLTEAQFHAEPRERGMEWPLKKYFEGYGRSQRVKFHSVLRRSKISTIIRDICTINEDYVQMKMQMAGPTSQGLFYSDAAFANNVATSFERVTNESGTVLPDIDCKNDILRSLMGHLSPSSNENKPRVQEVKEKAMKLEVNSMRHLIGINERSVMKGRRKLGSEVQQDKRKNTSPKKQDNKGKRKLVAKKRKIKKIKRNTWASSGDSTSDNETDERKKHLEESETKNVVIELVYETENGVVTALPDLSKAALPDLTGTAVTLENVTATDHLVTPDLTGTAVTLENVTATDPLVTPSTSIEIDSEELEPLKVKKIEKRDQKKTMLKSKFKKMGMLTMANFTEEVET